MLRHRHRQQGVSLVLAVFILVVLSMLAAAMLKILAGGSESVAREVISARALFAAESGAQRKLTEIFPVSGVTDISACATASYTWPGIDGCTTLNTDVVCSHKPVGGINYFTITSTGRCGPLDSPAVRVVEIQARDGL